MWLLSCIPLQLWVLLGLAFLVVTGLWVPFAASILRMIPLKIWVIIITIVLLLLGVWYQHDKWFHAGEQAATTKIENANKVAELMGREASAGMNCAGSYQGFQEHAARIYVPVPDWFP